VGWSRRTGKGEQVSGKLGYGRAAGEEDQAIDGSIAPGHDPLGEEGELVLRTRDGGAMMRRRLVAALALIVVFVGGILARPLLATSGFVDFDAHWLAAGCTRTQGKAVTVNTEWGPAIQHAGGSVGAVTLYCNVAADAYHNLIQLWAEDSTADGSVTASLYRQAVTEDVLGAPELVIAVTTTDQPGLQRAELFGEIGDLDESRYLYYLRLRLSRTTVQDVVRVYNVGLRDVL
jgi:hypothetical protein